MTNTFKTASLNPINLGTDVIYTAPAGTNALVISALATSENNAPGTAALGILRSGASEINWVASSINVAAGSSVNLLAGRLALNTGDKIVANNFVAGISRRTRADGSHCFTGEPSLMLSNADGSIIVAVCPSGIYTSTDGCKTSSQTRAEALTTTVGTFFAGAFHVYVSATSKRVSTDGETWTTVACTNAPTSPCSLFGDIIQKAGALFGMASMTQMVTSSDGTTWTNYGVALPAACQSLCWTGTNWVAGGSTAVGNCYWSTNAAAWTTTAVGGGTNTVGQRGLAAVGALVVAMVQTGSPFYPFRSSDHGVTFAIQSGQQSQAGSGVFSVGSKFVGWQNGTSTFLSSTGLNGDWTSVPNPLAVSFSYPLCIAGTKLRSARAESFDLELTRRGGMTITASILEIAP